MEEWLKKLWQKFRHRKLGLAILFLIVLFAILNPISLVSGIGYADEIKNHRRVIIEFTLAVAVIVILVSYYIRILKEKNILKQRIDGLQSKVTDLEQQRESAFRLMERYKEDAQEDIFNRLKQLAIFSIKQSEWQKKGAKIERFRLEESLIDNELDIELLIGEHITVLINIGAQDDVHKGMRFIVQDPTDSQKYGVILVKETSDNGAACSIVEINHQAFWFEVIQAIESKNGKARILEASANVLVPYSPLKGMQPDSARQLLEWLQTVERTEL
jgi:hypothetical protein